MLRQYFNKKRNEFFILSSSQLTVSFHPSFGAAENEIIWREWTQMKLFGLHCQIGTSRETLLLLILQRPTKFVLQRSDLWRLVLGMIYKKFSFTLSLFSVKLFYHCSWSIYNLLKTTRTIIVNWANWIFISLMCDSNIAVVFNFLTHFHGKLSTVENFIFTLQLWYFRENCNLIVVLFNILCVLVWGFVWFCRKIVKIISRMIVCLKFLDTEINIKIFDISWFSHSIFLSFKINLSFNCLNKTLPKVDPISQPDLTGSLLKNHLTRFNRSGFSRT
jgi:hypothetical protein